MTWLKNTPDFRLLPIYIEDIPHALSKPAVNTIRSQIQMLRMNLCEAANHLLVQSEEFTKGINPLEHMPSPKLGERLTEARLKGQ